MQILKNDKQNVKQKAHRDKRRAFGFRILLPQWAQISSTKS